MKPCFPLILLLLTVLTVKGESIEKPKEVVLLNSYHYGLAWTDGITTAVSEALQGHNILLEVEYMDSKRRSYESVKENYLSYLQGKYVNRSPSIVIASDNNALTFLQEYKTQVFQDSVIIFCGINNYSDELIDGLTERATGVVEQTDPRGTFEMIQKVQPELNRLVVISGTSPTSINLHALTQRELQGIESEVEIEWWHGWAMKDILIQSSKLGRGDAILLLTLNQDANGSYFSYQESALSLSRNSTVPIYGLWDFYLGSGVVGGRIITAQSQGDTAAKLALQYLKNGNLPQIVRKSPNESLLVYGEMMRTGMDLSNVPEDIFVLNRPLETVHDAMIIATVVVASAISLAFVIYAVMSTIGVSKSKWKLSKVLRNNTMAVLGTTVFLMIAVLVGIELNHFRSTSGELRNRVVEEKKNEIKKMVLSLSEEIGLMGSVLGDSNPNEKSILRAYTKDRVQRATLGNQYYFVLDSSGAVIFHPTLPEIVGKNFSDQMDDPRGQFIRQMLDAAAHPSGDFLQYKWQKPGGTEISDKIAFIKKVEGIDWIIGFGVYLDELELELDQTRTRMKTQMLREVVVALFAGVLSLLLVLFVSRGAEKKISAEIKRLNSGIETADLAALDEEFDISEFASIGQHALKVFNEMKYTQEKCSKTFLLNSEMMVLVDADTRRIVEVNKAFTEKTKLEAPAVVGMSLNELEVFDSEENIRLFDACLQGQNSSGDELKYYDLEGDVHYAELNSQHIRIADQTLILFAFHDTTKRRKDSEMISLLSRAIEQSPVSVVITDTNGSIEYVNPTFCKTTGFTYEEALGENPRVLKSGETDGEIYAALWDTIKRGEQWVGEFHNKRKNGELFWESATISGVKSESGQVTHFLAVKEDITEKKKLQSQLLHAQKLESVGQLAAGVAHEINTPIQFINDNLEFLKTSLHDLVSLSNAHQSLVDKLQGVDEYEADVETNREQFEEADFEFLKTELPLAIDQSIEGTQRVAKIVRAMKEFSHPGSEAMEQIDLNHSIQTTITVTRNEWKYVAELETDFDESLKPVPCFVGELNQVILNMIINARDAIEEKASGTQGIIRIKTQDCGSEVCISISDNGTGMPPEVQKRIFDPFYTTKEVGKGTGQGLNIAHNVIVNKHKGSIGVVKSSSEGTTFEIYLPYAQMEADAFEG